MGWLDKYEGGGEVDAVSGAAPKKWQVPIKQREDFKGNWLNKLISNNIVPFKKGLDVGAIVDNDTLMRLSNKRVSGELNNEQVTDSIRSYIKDRKTGEPLNKIKPFRPSNINASRDALYLHQGLPQKHNSFSVSKYTPSKSSNSETDYYAFTDEAKSEIINDLFKGKNKDFLESNEKERQVKNSTVGQAALRNFKYSKGKDDRGDYISYYDVNDYNNFLDKIGKPFEIYDRIYVDRDSTGNYIPREDFKNGGQINENTNNTFADGGGVTPKEFALKYIQSPKYKERITSSGYENVEDEILQRLQNVNKTKTYTQYGAPSLKDQLSFEKNKTPYTPGGSSFLPLQDAIVLDLKQAEDLKIDPRFINAHEFGHAEVNRPNAKTTSAYDKKTGIRRSRLNEQDVSDIIKRLSGTSNPVYKKVPDEIKSDINSLRYELYDKGIYDAGYEDVSPEQLKRLDDSYIKNRLLKNLSEEDLIWLMNNIAMNNKLQNTNQFSNFTNPNWLEKYS